MVYQGDQGLVQGLQTGLQGVLQGLDQRGRNKSRSETLKNISNEIQKGEFDLNKVLKLITIPGAENILPALSPFITPQLKAQAGVAAGKQIDEDYAPISKGTLSSTLDSSNVPGPSDSNGLGPLEQTLYQQGGQQSTSLDPAMESPIPRSPIEISKFKTETEIGDGEEVIETKSGTYPASDYIDTPYGKFHPRQISRYLNSGNPGLVEQGKLIDKYIQDKEKLEGKEGIEKRKEWRQEISKFAEPYKDLTKLKSSVKKLEKAKELILSGKTSRDGNWIRRATQAILEDANAPTKAELLKTPEDQILYSLLYDTLRTKDLGGSNPSTREVLLSLAAKPSPYKGEKANVAVVNDLLRAAIENEAKGQAITEIRDRSGPISFPRFQRELQDRVMPELERYDKQMGKESLIEDAKLAVRNKTLPKGVVWMMAPTGKPIKVPHSQIIDVQSKGGILLNGK